MQARGVILRRGFEALDGDRFAVAAQASVRLEPRRERAGSPGQAEWARRMRVGLQCAGRRRGIRPGDRGRARYARGHRRAGSAPSHHARGHLGRNH